jgi:hypothetical protein
MHVVQRHWRDLTIAVLVDQGVKFVVKGVYFGRLQLLERARTKLGLHVHPQQFLVALERTLTDPLFPSPWSACGNPLINPAADGELGWVDVVACIAVA